jgi:GGDEF domain-containing protein
MNQFREAITPLLPGCLALFDLADTKRRNLHLGYNKVDQDIAWFEILLNQCIETTGIAKRIGGDKWIAFTVGSSPNYRALLQHYPQEEHVTIGVICRATSIRGDSIVVRKQIQATIFRAFRCLYTWLEDKANFDATLEILNTWLWQCSVNEVTVYDEATLMNRPQGPRWQCLSEEVMLDKECPFCKGRGFDWYDGATDCATGRCEKCGASCDFTFY